MKIHPLQLALRIAAASLALAGSVQATAEQVANEVREGKIFTSSNSTNSNELLVYAPGSAGDLSLVARAATYGQGTGAGLGSEGAVTLSKDGRFVFVVNAGSSTISAFELRGSTPVLTSVVDSGGLVPISVAEHDGLVYVLNAGGAGNVFGFRNVGGELRPIADSSRGLSAAGGTGPAQVGFDSDGRVLVVTEKTTSRLLSYKVGHEGTLGQLTITPSSGPVPFGFAFDRRNHLIVSEADASAASSYDLGRQGDAAPVLLTGSVTNGQGAACWVVVTPDGRFAYTANAGTSNLSSYRIEPGGQIKLSSGAAGSTGVDAGATDLAVSTGGRHLYALAPRSQQIVAYDVGYDGSIAAAGAASGVPEGSVGLAAN